MRSPGEVPGSRLPKSKPPRGPKQPHVQPAHGHGKAKGKPRGALVLMHGRGADEHDLAPLLQALDPEGDFVGLLLAGR